MSLWQFIMTLCSGELHYHVRHVCVRHFQHGSICYIFGSLLLDVFTFWQKLLYYLREGTLTAFKSSLEFKQHPSSRQLHMLTVPNDSKRINLEWNYPLIITELLFSYWTGLMTYQLAKLVAFPALCRQISITNVKISFQVILKGQSVLSLLYATFSLE